MVASGNFGAGTIQYVFSYYTKYGAETNIFYSSPLYYASYNNRGADAESRVSNSFDIDITGADTSFDYLRIYSIHRTSIDTTPTVLNVVDLAVANDMHYTDSGVTGKTVDPTELIYKGSEPITVGTIAQKDNTLFLGDIKLIRRLIATPIREALSGGDITFSNEHKTLSEPDPKGYYPYESQLSKSSE